MKTVPGRSVPFFVHARTPRRNERPSFAPPRASHRKATTVTRPESRTEPESRLRLGNDLNEAFRFVGRPLRRPLIAAGPMKRAFGEGPELCPLSGPSPRAPFLLPPAARRRSGKIRLARRASAKDLARNSNQLVRVPAGKKKVTADVVPVDGGVAERRVVSRRDQLRAIGSLRPCPRGERRGIGKASPELFEPPLEPAKFSTRATGGSPSPHRAAIRPCSGSAPPTRTLSLPVPSCPGHVDRGGNMKRAPPGMNAHEAARLQGTVSATPGRERRQSSVAASTGAVRDTGMRCRRRPSRSRPESRPPEPHARSVAGPPRPRPTPRPVAPKRTRPSRRAKKRSAHRFIASSRVRGCARPAFPAGPKGASHDREPGPGAASGPGLPATPRTTEQRRTRARKACLYPAPRAASSAKLRAARILQLAAGARRAPPGSSIAGRRQRPKNAPSMAAPAAGASPPFWSAGPPGARPP